MNRETKFRVWLKGKIFGYERISKDGNWESMCLELNPDNGERWVNVIFGVGACDHRDEFTGLFDKNRKEIFEGDIVKVHDHPTGVNSGIGQVVFNRGNFEVEGSLMLTLPLKEYGTAWTEIIGNIYENPELLK